MGKGMGSMELEGSEETAGARAQGKEGTWHLLQKAELKACT